MLCLLKEKVIEQNNILEATKQTNLDNEEQPKQEEKEQVLSFEEMYKKAFGIDLKSIENAYLAGFYMENNKNMQEFWYILIFLESFCC